MLTLKVKEETIESAYALASEIPEFSDGQYDLEEYKKRLGSSDHLILVAYHLNKPVGFKVGYRRDEDGSFYSWMGGVLPQDRHRHVAKILAEHQEEWAKDHGYKSVKLKTRNRNKGMLLFAMKNDFDVIDIEQKENPQDSRIWLEKKLQ